MTLNRKKLPLLPPRLLLIFLQALMTMPKRMRRASSVPQLPKLPRKTSHRASTMRSATFLAKTNSLKKSRSRLRLTLRLMNRLPRKTSRRALTTRSVISSVKMNSLKKSRRLLNRSPILPLNPLQNPLPMTLNCRPRTEAFLRSPLTPI